MLAMVASLYYELDQSQTQIANRLGVSSSKISRMLKEARDRGIVHIRVEKPVPRDFALEQQLIELFGLRDAHVLQTFNDADETTMLSSTGRIAASYLWSVIPNPAPGASIGVAWGNRCPRHG
ncbi:MAG: sugar-binding domain-containing protein [Caldilineaceae bacterium]